jgi:lysyl-tRNA synthetase class 2
VKPRIHGRCIQITQTEITIINEAGIARYPLFKDVPPFKVGDLLSISERGVEVLTVQQSKKTSLTFQSRILDPRRMKAMRVRGQVETFIRDYFSKMNFHEVRTPLLVKSPGMEAHIDPYQVKTGQFLPSSPEFAMKKLLVGGLERIYQLGPAFRNEAFSQHHRPEFTMLEFYRAYSNHEAIMKDFENLVETMALKLHGQAQFRFGEQNISVKTPWLRLSVNELFKRELQIDLKIESSTDQLRTRAERLGLKTQGDSWDEIYFRLWIDFIEPQLPKNEAVFVTHYPASQAALSNIDANGWAKRFEAYLGGLEICNGFDELTDAIEQRRRFEEEITLREKLYQDQSLLDENFLLALEEGMPPSGGVAVGIDRLIMLMADEADIEYCFWLNPEPNQ